MTMDTAGGGTPTLELFGNTFVVDLGDGLNQFTPRYVESLRDCIVTVRSHPRPCGFVTKASGRFWCMGLDLEWIAAHSEAAPGLVRAFQEVLADLLTLGAYSVAAVEGPAVGAGAVLAVAHDTMVMSSGRASWSLPEVNLGLVLPAGFVRVIAARTPARMAHEAVSSGRRYRGEEALRAGIVGELVDPSTALEAALAQADENATRDPATVSAVKSLLHAELVAYLRSGELAAVPAIPQAAMEALRQ